MLMTIIGILVGLVILGCAVVALYIAMQGDAEMRLLTKKRTDAVKVSEAGDRLDFQLEVPFDNIGKQEGTILDTYMRIYLPQEQYDDVLLRGKVNLEGVLRDDDYFEALLVPAGTGKNLVLRFEAYAKHGKTLADDEKICLLFAFKKYCGTGCRPFSGKSRKMPTESTPMFYRR